MNRRSTSNPEDRNDEFHLDEHLCVDLIHGFLPPAERERVFSHIATCPACERLLQEKVAERERLRATKVLRRLPGGELVLEKRGEASPAARVRDRRHWDILSSVWAGLRQPRFQLAGGLAAAVAVFLLVVWPGYVRPPETPHLQLLRPYSFELQPREMQEAVPSEELSAGLEAYASRDLTSSINLLEKAEVSGRLETVRRIYLGSALAWSGRHEEAVRVLEEVSFPSVPGEWGREAYWTLYVALKESGRQASADSLLQILAQEPGKLGERARRFLKQ